MEIAETRKGDVLILAPAGRLDTKTSHDFEKKALEHLTAGERRFVVDLAALEYLSSAGLRVLLMLAKKLAGTGGNLALCSLSEPVRTVFDIAGFTSIFTICASQAEAVAASPSAAKSVSALEMAVKALGVSRGATGSMARPDTGDAELAARAARLLGVKVPEAPPAKPSRGH